MLKFSKSDYAMTCDQDDVWLPDKIEITYNKMKEAESEYNNKPILVHTDLKVVDKKLNVISNSLMKMQNLDSSRDRLNNLLVQNIVTGCTVMVNRNLLKFITDIPKDVIMHDWWMALIASSLGKIVFVDKATVLYRQHQGNEVGAKNVKSSEYILYRLSNIKLIKELIDNSYIQAEELKQSIGSFVEKEDYALINQYSSLQGANKLKKLQILIKYKLLKDGLFRAIGQILFC